MSDNQIFMSCCNVVRGSQRNFPLFSELASNYRIFRCFMFDSQMKDISLYPEILMRYEECSHIPASETIHKAIPGPPFREPGKVPASVHHEQMHRLRPSETQEGRTAGGGWRRANARRHP